MTPMLDNYAATLHALYAFVWANAPEGSSPHAIACLREALAQPIDPRTGKTVFPTFYGLEVRPEPGTEATLQIRVEGEKGPYDFESHTNADGNVWHAYRVRCEVSWPSFGSDNVEICQRRLAVMGEVTRFAAAIQRAFPHVFHQLYQTKADVERSEAERKVRRTKERLRTVGREKVSGMRVGAFRYVQLDGDLLRRGGFEALDVAETFGVDKPGGTRYEYVAVSTGSDTFRVERTK